MIREYFKKRKIRKSFEEHLAKDVVDAVKRGEYGDLCKLTPASIDIVVAEVRGDTPEIISQRIALVVDLALEPAGVVQDIVSSFVVVTYGMFRFEQRGGNRISLVQGLAEQLNGDIKVIHSVRNGVYGNLGGKKRLAYSFIIPGFVEMLATLANMEFSQTKYIP